ncbi:MAG TPA: tail fiber domain-containing protein [Bacteroidetes bacterium]|nr:tail fiber domain-containing protein [Bacteroidota bacterium]
MKYLSKLFTLAVAITAFLFIVPQANAQLTVDAQGDVGIGITSTPFKLDVRNSVDYLSFYTNNYYSGTTTKYGIYNYVNSSGTGSRNGLTNIIYSNAASSSHYGLRNQNYIYSTGTGYGQYNYTYSYAGNGVRYGIYNYLGCGSGSGAGTKYALYSAVASNCSGTKYAGYFSGNVYVAGTLTQTSDASKKSNIQPMSGALGIISQLQPKTYNYKFDEDLALPQEKQYGFLAQELEQILPTLVKDVDVLHNEAADMNKKGLDENGLEQGTAEPVSVGEIKTVNYIALIPILVQGMQEQQKVIEEQKQRIDELEAYIKH